MIRKKKSKRIVEAFEIALILMAVCSWLLSVIPNYGRSIYNQAQKVDYDKYTDQSGYPAGDGFEELTTYDEIKKNKYNYITEVDAEDLTPISVYKSLQEDEYYKRKFAVYDDEKDGGTATFYTAKLKSGEKVIVLIDDRTFTIPESGRITLPVARTGIIEYTSILDAMMEETGLMKDEVRYYVDVAGVWRKGPEGSKIEGRIRFVMNVMFLAGAPLLTVILYFMDKKSEEKLHRKLEADLENI